MGGLKSSDPTLSYMYTYNVNYFQNTKYTFAPNCSQNKYFKVRQQFQVFSQLIKTKKKACWL